MAKDLYENEPVFKETIQKCDFLIQEMGGGSIIPNFESEDKEFLSDESNLIYILASIQISLFELWKTKGKAPGAILGISLGEVAAVYAAGGLSLRDALRIVSLIVMLNKLEEKAFSVVYVQQNLSSANELSKHCPVWISTIYESTENGVLLFCRTDDLTNLESFLKKENIAWKIPHKEVSWPYHTLLIKQHRNVLLSCIREIVPKPLQCDYYSCTLGKLIPKNTIIPPEHWYNLTYLPVLAHTTFQQIKNDGYEVLVNIGPNLPMKFELGETAHKNIRLLNTMLVDEPAVETLEHAIRQVKRSKVQTNYFASSNESEARLRDFKNQLNFLADGVKDNPYPYFRYLQQKKSVHFLPVYNAWIVMDYEDIDYVLKHPEIFSNKIYSGFDQYLLGTDPPEHTEVRQLLLPLFSSQAFARLSGFIVERSHKLIEEWKDGHDHNFVDKFSLPLAKSVVAKFIGLDESDEKALDDCLDTHLYTFAYLDKLEKFFDEYLQNYVPTEEEVAVNLLISKVKEGNMAFGAAVSLLKILWIAGMTTTSALLSNALLMLAQNPEVAEKLRNDESLMSKFIEECLRLETPESEQKRVTTQDVKLGNELIPAGSLIMLGFRAANRDPKYFENPDEISFTRPLKRHLSFGGGYHYCLGAGLARLEAKHALKIVLERMPNLRLAQEQAPEYFPSPHFRGLNKLIFSGQVLERK